MHITSRSLSPRELMESKTEVCFNLHFDLRQFFKGFHSNRAFCDYRIKMLKRQEQGTKWERMKKTCYDPETKKFLGRDARNWGTSIFTLAATFISSYFYFLFGCLHSPCGILVRNDHRIFKGLCWHWETNVDRDAQHSKTQPRSVYAFVSKKSFLIS